MSRVITREQTKKLVRGLKKQLIGDREVFGIRSIVLYGDGKSRFMWLSEHEENVPYGVAKIGVPAAIAYDKDGAGNLRRKNLGELDELFYRVINSSSYSEKKAKMKEFKDKVVSKANSKLKYSELMLLDLGEYYTLTVTLYRVRGSKEFKNKDYQGRNGNDLGVDFIDFIENNSYDIMGVYEDSESGMMSVGIRDEYAKYWYEFVQATVDFDKELDTELKSNSYTVNIPLLATEFITLEAENEDEAFALVSNQVSNEELTFEYDPEPDNTWWVDDEDGTYVVGIPLIATEVIKVKAFSKEEAISIAAKTLEKHRIMTEYDPEPQSDWWVEEEG